MKTRDQKSGFTLVELMIVAAIIAILAAIVIPLLANNRERAVATEGQNICNTVATAAKVFYADNGRWPTGVDELPDVVESEIGNAKYFDGENVVFSGSASGSTLTYTVTVTADGDDSGDLTGSLTLDQDGNWGGDIANAVGIAD